MKSRQRKTIAALIGRFTFAAALALVPPPVLAADSVHRTVVGPSSTTTAANGNWTVLFGFYTAAVPFAGGASITGRWSVNVRGDYNQAATIPCAAGLFVDGGLVGTTKSISLGPVVGTTGYSYGLLTGEIDPAGVLLGSGAHYVSLQLYSVSSTGCSADANVGQMILELGGPPSFR